jgi:hypothetical protein
MPAARGGELEEMVRAGDAFSDSQIQELFFFIDANLLPHAT